MNDQTTTGDADPDVRISVIMPNYNYGHYIAQAIEAIVSQRQFIDEFIILDDCSTDNSVEVVAQALVPHPWVRFERNPGNGGFFAAIEKLLRLARGNWVFATSPDDYVLPGFFHHAVRALGEHPRAGLFCADPIYLNPADGVETRTSLPVAMPGGYIPPDQLARRLNGRFIPGHCSVLRRDLIARYGGYDPDLKWHCDWFMQLLLAFRHGLCYVPEPMAVMRIAPTTYSAAGRRRWSEQSLVLEHLFATLQSDACRDVYPRFVRGRALNHFGGQTLRLLLSRPGLWDCHTPRIVADALWYCLKSRVPERIKAPLRRSRSA